jgi:hypothetical protein
MKEPDLPFWRKGSRLPLCKMEEPENPHRPKGMNLATLSLSLPTSSPPSTDRPKGMNLSLSLSFGMGNFTGIAEEPVLE